ncbi:AMP-binding protein, partial [Nocardia sp. 2]
TYRELDEKSSQLAHRLVGVGVGLGDIVGLLLPRSADAVVAILAVLKTGAAYLPIDVHHPEQRVAFVLADASPVAVVTTAEHVARIASHSVVVVDMAEPAIETGPVRVLPTPYTRNLAYVIYTSGTTGVPKGVA